MKLGTNEEVSVPRVQRDWPAYYRAVMGRPPRETLLIALDQFPPLNPGDAPYFAIDLGCGNGRDTVELLRRGWRVLGIDGEPQAIAELLNRPDVQDAIQNQQLQAQVARFETVKLPAGVDLINASFSLPFCPPLYFPDFWENLCTALQPGGRFSGQLIGPRDSWATEAGVTSVQREQLPDLFRSFEMEYFLEEEHLGKTALGAEKYWQLFQIVARKL